MCLFNFVLVGPPYFWSPDLPCRAQLRPPGGGVAHSAPLLHHKRERRLAVNPTRLLGSVTVPAVTAAAAHRTAQQQHEQLLKLLPTPTRTRPGPDLDRSSGTAAMSPLQLSVYWRLALLFFFTPFLFFLDIFTAAIADRTCRHNNGTEASSWLGTVPPSADNNQSQYGEVSELSADWRTDKSEVCAS